MQGIFMACSRCNTRLEPTEQICKACGNSVNYQQNTGYHLYCNNCSIKVQKGVSRCMKCNNIFSWDTAANPNRTYYQPAQYGNISNINSMGTIRGSFRNSNWIRIGEIIGYITLILQVIIGFLFGASIGGAFGGMIGIGGGCVTGIMTVAVMMIFIGIAKDMRDIRNKICS